MWFKRIAREWVVLVAGLIGAAFTIGDGAGLIEFLTNNKPPREWVYSGVFILFAIVVIIRLVKLHAQIDERQGKIRLIARFGSLAINYPPSSVNQDEWSIDTTIYFDIWTDVDIHTDDLRLNILRVRRKRWWRFWELHLKFRRMIGIPMSDNTTYRKQIMFTDKQPFNDHATFKLRGKRDTVNWGDAFLLELALRVGSPAGVWRVYINPDLYQRGLMPPL